jgi:hypothetical protein
VQGYTVSVPADTAAVCVGGLVAGDPSATFQARALWLATVRTFPLLKPDLNHTETERTLLERD